MLSKAVGPTYGISKNAMVTIVRDPPLIGGTETMSRQAMINGYIQIFNDIVSKRLRRRAVAVSANSFQLDLAGTRAVDRYPPRDHPDRLFWKVVAAFASVEASLSTLDLGFVLSHQEHNHIYPSFEVLEMFLLRASLIIQGDYTDV